MIRLTLLPFVLVVSLTMTPQGCPMTGPVDANEPIVTDPIETSADATVEGGTIVDKVSKGQSVKLTATATTDESLYYYWVQTAGVGVEIEDATQPIASFAAPSVPDDQFLRFTVTTRSDAGGLGHADVSVPVAADPNYGLGYTFGDDDTIVPDAGAPVAHAGDDAEAVPGDEVTLDASESEGRSLSYAWQQSSGQTVELTGADTNQASFTTPVYDQSLENKLTFQVRVTDDRGRSASDTIAITVLDPSTVGPRVRVETTFGDFVVELYPDDAPKSVENFLEYVDDGFYSNTIFHRVIAGFVVQGGGFEPGLNKKDARDPIALEPGLDNDRGTVAMARTTDPDSATSQFFVNLVDNDFLNPSDTSEGYSVFGRVFSGMDVIDRIATVQTGSQSGFDDVPLTDIIIRQAVRLDE